jgi:hypothetical protein
VSYVVGAQLKISRRRSKASDRVDLGGKAEAEEMVSVFGGRRRGRESTDGDTSRSASSAGTRWSRRDWRQLIVKAGAGPCNKQAINMAWRPQTVHCTTILRTRRSTDDLQARAIQLCLTAEAGNLCRHQKMRWI